MSTITLSGTSSNDNPFYPKSPKPDAIKAVKLGATNIRPVAAYILTRIGGKVQADHGGIFRGDEFIADVGDWVVEDYDYVKDVVTFKRASIEQRQKYDLR